MVKKAPINIPILINTIIGMEAALQSELRSLGYSSKRLSDSWFEISGTMHDFEVLNNNLKTAIRVYQIIKRIHFESIEKLKRILSSIPWSRYMDITQTFRIDSSGQLQDRSQSIKQSKSLSQSPYQKKSHNTNYLNLLVKDAIVDHFRAKTGKRPDVERKTPDIGFTLFIWGNQILLSRDSTGKPLNHRYYRRELGPAPLNEVTARGLVMLSGWDGKSMFIDPMCGSGTIAIEAALEALKQMGLSKNDFLEGRRSFAYEHWIDWKGSEQAKKELPTEPPSLATIDSKGLPRIIAADKDPKMIALAKKNIKAAGLEEVITCIVADFSELRNTMEKNGITLEDRGMLIMNPPFDLRIKDHDLMKLYKSLGDTFKKNWSGWDAAIYSHRIDALKKVGLRTKFKKHFLSGGLDTRFHGYSIN